MAIIHQPALATVGSTICSQMHAQIMHFLAYRIARYLVIYMGCSFRGCLQLPHEPVIFTDVVFATWHFCRGLMISISNQLAPALVNGLISICEMNLWMDLRVDG